MQCALPSWEATIAHTLIYKTSFPISKASKTQYDMISSGAQNKKKAFIATSRPSFCIAYDANAISGQALPFKHSHFLKRHKVDIVDRVEHYGA